MAKTAKRFCLVNNEINLIYTSVHWEKVRLKLPLAQVHINVVRFFDWPKLNDPKEKRVLKCFRSHCECSQKAHGYNIIIHQCSLKFPFINHEVIY